MRQFLLLFSIAISFSLPITTHAQVSDSDNFEQLLQSYYLTKNDSIVNLAIDFLNTTDYDYKVLEHILTGFFGALFYSDENIKKEFILKKDRISNKAYGQLFKNLLNTDIETIYSEIEMSSTFNDMNWSSYFATGDNKYVDNIIRNLKYDTERSNMNLYLTGATAKWSLCANSKVHYDLIKYLSILADSNLVIKEILIGNPDDYKKEMVDVLVTQREKGIWNY